MSKSILTIVILSLSGSIFGQQKTKKFQYIPHYNKNIISGTIAEAFKSKKWGKEFYWFRIDNSKIHVWEKDLDTTMKVGKQFTFTGIKILTGNLDKLKIEERKQNPTITK